MIGRALVQLGRNAFVHHAHYGIVYVLSHKHLAPLAVYYLAHLVHHVVVLKHVFADIKVVAFHPLLRVLYLL